MRDMNLSKGTWLRVELVVLIAIITTSVYGAKKCYSCLDPECKKSEEQECTNVTALRSIEDAIELSRSASESAGQRSNDDKIVSSVALNDPSLNSKRKRRRRRQIRELELPFDRPNESEYHCYKIHVSSKGVSFVNTKDILRIQKGCVIPKDTVEEHCIKVSNFSENGRKMDGFACWCKTDLCNGAYRAEFVSFWGFALFLFWVHFGNFLKPFLFPLLDR